MIRYLVWIHGQSGNSVEVETSSAVEAIRIVAARRPTPFTYYSGETVELCARPVLLPGAKPVATVEITVTLP